MAPPEYPKIVVTPSSASTCTIISAPVILRPARGCLMDGAPGAADALKSRILVDFVGCFVMGRRSLAVCSLTRNRYSGRRVCTAKNTTKHASYHRHPPPERGRRAHPRDRVVLYPRLQHRVA